MSLGIFKRENLINAWYAYYVHNVPDLYPTIVGASEQARIDYNQYAKSDAEQQLSFVEETCSDDNFGRGNYVVGGAPADGYNNPSNPFCHAMDAYFNVNNVAHRLYINLGENRMGFARAFTYVCVERNIPYYFKWSKDGARADNMVIYVEKDRLADTCKVIQDIAQINHHLVQNDRPLPMSVEDCGWFGYGVEGGDRSQSFSRKVTNSLRAAFDEIRMAYNNDNESINGVLNNSETCEQFWQWAEYMVAKRFEHDNIPMSLEEQMPEEIRMLANMRNMIWSMDQ